VAERWSRRIGSNMPQHYIQRCATLLTPSPYRMNRKYSSFPTRNVSHKRTSYAKNHILVRRWRRSSVVPSSSTLLLAWRPSREMFTSASANFRASSGSRRGATLP
jgi:hypothetical protein